MEKTIRISVRNKIATVTKDALYVCGNTDYVVAFDFDAEWDDFDIKTARFIHDGEFTDVVFSGNQCEIPAIFDVFGLKIGVFSGDLSTTTPVYIRAVKSILCDDEPPADPTPDVYGQIMEAVNEIKAIAQSVRDDAANGKFNSPYTAKIQTLSYVGTGVYGEAYPNKIVFEFKPKVVIIKRHQTRVPTNADGSEKTIGVNDATMIAFYGEKTSASSWVSGETSWLYCTHLNWSGNSLSWWGESDTRHLNILNTTYNVLAIG